MAEKITRYTKQELRELASKPPERGYQTNNRERLVLSRKKIGWMILTGNFNIPDDPKYFVDDHSNRDGVDPALLDRIVTIDNPAAPEQTERWRREGYRIDKRRGLPIHPRALQLLPAIGMFAGPGFSYRYGPQRATNLGLRVTEGDTAYYLLTKAYSRDVWGFPGGYQDEGESLVTGAYREAREEGGIIIPKDMEQGLSVVSTWLPPSGVRRDTLNSWMEQSFHFVEAPSTMDRQAFGELNPLDTHEVQMARWCTREEILSGIIRGVEGLPDLPIMNSHQAQVAQNELRLAA